MSEIQVHTSDLRNGSQIFDDASNKLGDVQSQFSRVLANIGSAYDGQLRQAIEGIVGGSAQTGSRLQSRAAELVKELINRAIRFESANQASYSAMLTPFQYFINLQRSSSILSALFFINPLSLKNAAFLWGIGGLGFGGLISLIVLTTKNDIQVPQEPVVPGQPHENKQSDGSITSLPSRIPIEVKQNDPNWADEPMGPNGDLREFGCFVTALTMLARYHQVDITPKDFNKWLRENDGYIKNSSYLIHDQAQKYLNSILPYQGKFDKTEKGDLDLDTINSDLKAGSPVVLHVPNPNNLLDGHYVLAIPPPMTDGTFTVLDPWTPGRSTYSFDEVTGTYVFSEEN